MKTAFLHEQETREALSKFVLESTRLSMDEQCGKFEKEFSAFQGSRDALLFNSGGSANLAILQTLKNLGKLKDGDKVGFSATTWSTNVMPIIQLNLQPVAIDCTPEKLNVTSETLLKRLSDTQLRAVFITNALGFTGDLDKIKQICESENIILIEDNCESLGTELPSGKAGNFGIMSSFSFYVAHHMSTIEGGMVCTDDTELAEMLRIVRANGWDRNLSSEQQKKWRERNKINTEFDSKYTFYDLGYNFRPTEITGFLGRFQLKYLKDSFVTREEQYSMFASVVAQNPELIALDRSHIKLLSNFSFPVIAKTPELKNKYVTRFQQHEIEIRPIIGGNMQNQPFYRKYVSEIYELPGTSFIQDCGFYCGNYPGMEPDEIQLISSCLVK